MIDAEPFRLFATVGTDYHRFDRLVDWIDRWIVEHRSEARLEAVVQAGTSRPPHYAVFVRQANGVQQADREEPESYWPRHPGQISSTSLRASALTWASARRCSASIRLASTNARSRRPCRRLSPPWTNTSRW